MTVKSLLLILLGGVLANNYALQKFLGVTPFLGYSRDESRIAGMGLAVNNIGAGYNFVESLVAALGVGLGFMLAMFLFAGVQSRINEKYVPKAFRGLPVSLLAACIISLALFAF